MNNISIYQYLQDEPEKQSELSAVVMRRVWVVYFVRRVINSEIFKGAVFGACCVTAVFMVSVPNIIQNVISVQGITAEVAYLMGAFMKTSLAVEGVVVVAVGVGGLLLWDIGRNVGHGVGHLSQLGQSLFMRGRTRV